MKFVIAALLLFVGLPAALASADNRYCEAGDVPQFTGLKGPASAPATCFNTARANTPSPGKIWHLSSGASITNAYNAASCGDVIELQEQGVFTAFNLTAKHCDDNHWITIKTAGFASLPAEGTRITPCYAGVASLPGRSYPCSSPNNVMARIIFNITGDHIRLGTADHVRLLGLEMTIKAKVGIVYRFIDGGTSYKTIIEQCWLHGDSDAIGDEVNHGISTNLATYLAAIDSYFNDIKCIAAIGSCTDAQAIFGGVGSPGGAWGTYKFVNNFLEASGEGMLFGGGAATATPDAMEIRRNDFFKPQIWMPTSPKYDGGAKGHPLIVKNCFELKNGTHVFMEGNIFDGSWGGFTQFGNCVTVTPKDQSNLCPNCKVDNLVIRHSVIRDACQAFQISNTPSDSGGWASGGHHYSIYDVVAYGLLKSGWYRCPGYLNQVSTNTTATGNEELYNIYLDHITEYADNAISGLSTGLMFVGGPKNPKQSQVVFQNSVLPSLHFGIHNVGEGSTNQCAYSKSNVVLLQACWYPMIYTNNLFAGTGGGAWNSSTFPHNLVVMSQAAVGFTSIAGNNFQLLSSSPGYRKASDGTDIGANIPMINAYTAGVQ